jgi:hypothetical protein
MFTSVGEQVCAESKSNRARRAGSKNASLVAVNSRTVCARCLGLRRSVLRYSELPSSGRSCCITAQGEDELSDMPDLT